MAVLVKQVRPSGNPAEANTLDLQLRRMRAERETRDASLLSRGGRSEASESPTLPERMDELLFPLLLERAATMQASAQIVAEMCRKVKAAEARAETAESGRDI